jgi:hypothetical protein
MRPPFLRENITVVSNVAIRVWYVGDKPNFYSGYKDTKAN